MHCLMSIKISITAPGMAIQAQVKDEALAELLKLTQQYREEGTRPGEASNHIVANPLSSNLPPAILTDENVRNSLKTHGAAELLTLVRWDTYPDKILLLGAWHEAQAGSTPWRSGDMDAIFAQAKEQSPANFPRDIKQAIKSGWIHAVTPRTYTVTVTGWRRIGDALQRLQTA